VGKQEAADNTVNVNERSVEEKRTISVSEFAEELKRKVDTRS
jgi:threonyl-tRNA synthetase